MSDMSNVVEALKAARALIEDPKRWATRALARDAEGIDVSYDAKDATCFCMVGAAARVGASQPRLYEAGDTLGAGHLTLVNDGKALLLDGSTGHPAVLKIYDKAIELAEAEASK